MVKNNKTTVNKNSIIASNKKARLDYFIEKEFDAGLVLEGWEVKSLRSGKGQLTDSYVLFKNSEAWLIGLHIYPLLSASTHVTPDPQRTRKLLLNKKEISFIFGKVKQQGFSCVPLKMFWHKQKVKCKIALAQGKKDYDKRHAVKDRDWKIQKARVLKNSN
jgi:SsrA-binding protein